MSVYIPEHLPDEDLGVTIAIIHSGGSCKDAADHTGQCHYLLAGAIRELRDEGLLDANRKQCW